MIPFVRTLGEGRKVIEVLKKNGLEQGKDGLKIIMYVRRGSAPTTSTYDCRPYTSGNSETCTFNAPTAGTYYVNVRAYAAYSGVSLKGTISP